jgi:integrase/recombinase XerD
VEKPSPLSIEELQRLLEASSPKHRAMWAAAAGQGLRPGELNRIRWEDIHFEGRTLHVRGTKTEEADAVVPLTPLAHRELLSWWLREGQPTVGMTFQSRNGAAYGDQGWKKALKEAARAAGIERRVYPYLLRDSFATIAWGAGIPLDLARRVMRHTAKSRVLEEVYCRPRAEDVALRIQAFDIDGVGGS